MRPVETVSRVLILWLVFYSAGCSGGGGGSGGEGISSQEDLILSTSTWTTGQSPIMQLASGAPDEFGVLMLDTQATNSTLPSGASFGLGLSPTFLKLGTAVFDSLGNALLALGPVDSSLAGLQFYLQAVSVPVSSGPSVSLSDPDLRTSNVVAITVTDSNDPASNPPANEASPVGINLAPARYWSSQVAFVDLFRLSDEFRPNSGILNLRADGYPASLGAGQIAWTIMATSIGGHYPAGRYVCLYDGTGTVELRLDATEVDVRPGRTVCDVAPTDKGVMLEIKATDPGDPIHNIRLIMPGFVNSYASQPFHPTFLDLVDDYKILRFMDWMATNNSTVQEWADRTTLSEQTQGGEAGVAAEILIELANTTQADPWFCIPHLASDDYVTQLATLVRDQLAPSLKAHVEYSNEVWNGTFSQASYAEQMGLFLGLDASPTAARLKYYSQRSVEIFQIWEQVFGDTSRIVRVLAAQSANPWTSTTILNWQSAYLEADALAIAPYFGGYLGRSPNAEVTVTWDVDQVLDACDADLGQIATTLAAHRSEAIQKGLSLIAYEGGQHLVGVGSWQTDPTLNALFDQANIHPRMQTLYEDYMEVWKAAGGEFFVLFNDTSTHSQFGRWGLLEWADQDPTTSSKYQGTFNFVYQNPRWW